MKKLSKVLSVLMMVIMVTMAMSPAVAAVGDMIEPDYTSDVNDNIKSVGSKILGIVTTVALVAAVIVVAILGVKYIIGSTEDKAGYKKAFMPYIVGLLLVAASSQIANWIWSFASNLE